MAPSTAHRHADQRLLIFDGDDTLWETEHLYDAARDRAAEVVRVAGFNPEEWSALQKSIDLENVQTMGLSRERFPTSSVQAYERCAGESVDDTTRQSVWEAAASVFSTPAPILPDVAETLATLARQHVLVLLTKGDRDVQHSRVSDLAFLDVFDAFVIVAHKTSATFAGLCAIYETEPSRAWSIGNSLPSDIVPAYEAGLRTVWLDAHVWEHERRELDVPAPVIRLESISHLPDAISLD